jgi:hypothetical protein
MVNIVARLPFTKLHKKDSQQNILHGMLLALARGMPIGTHTRTYVSRWARSEPGARSTAWSTICLRSSKPLYCHVFKSW